MARLWSKLHRLLSAYHTLSIYRPTCRWTCALSARLKPHLPAARAYALACLSARQLYPTSAQTSSSQDGSSAPAPWGLGYTGAKRLGG